MNAKDARIIADAAEKIENTSPPSVIDKFFRKRLFGRCMKAIRKAASNGKYVAELRAGFCEGNNLDVVVAILMGKGYSVRVTGRDGDMICISWGDKEA